MNRTFLVAVAAISWLAATAPAWAQQPAKIPRIGFLSATSLAPNQARIDAFKLGLRELGYVEGKNIVIDYRWAEGSLDRLPGLTAELLRLNVDILVTAGPADTKAARQATRTIPIVMAFDPDPVANGFVDSLARPGGNITGLSTLAPELSGKQLELLKQLVPRLSRVAVLGSPVEPGNARVVKELELAARALNLQLQHLDIRDAGDIETAFRAAVKGRADGVLVLQSPFVLPHHARFIDLAEKTRLPVMYTRSEMVDAGGLLSYGASLPDLTRRTATYIDKILKGRRPADLPVEQPTRFELIINLKAAKQIGLAVPPSVSSRADRVLN